MLRVWDSLDHRATMDIDLLARTSNQIDNLHQIITEDFYDLWTILKSHEMQSEKLSIAIQKVFANRKTPFKRPVAFSPEFYDNKETQRRWNNFLSAMGKPQIKFEDVILELSRSIEVYLDFPT